MTALASDVDFSHPITSTTTGVAGIATDVDFRRPVQSGSSPASSDVDFSRPVVRDQSQESADRPAGSLAAPPPFTASKPDLHQPPTVPPTAHAPDNLRGLDFRGMTDEQIVARVGQRGAAEAPDPTVQYARPPGLRPGTPQRGPGVDSLGKTLVTEPAGVVMNMGARALAGVAGLAGHPETAKQLTDFAAADNPYAQQHPEWNRGAIGVVRGGERALTMAGLMMTPLGAAPAVGAFGLGASGEAAARGAGRVGQITEGAVNAAAIMILGHILGGGGNIGRTVASALPGAIRGPLSEFLAKFVVGGVGMNAFGVGSGVAQNAAHYLSGVPPEKWADVLHDATSANAQVQNAIFAILGASAEFRQHLADPKVQEAIKEVAKVNPEGAAKLTGRAAAMAKPPATSEQQVTGTIPEEPIHALQEQKSAAVDVQPAPGNGKTLGQGNTVDQGIAREGAPVREGSAAPPEAARLRPLGKVAGGKEVAPPAVAGASPHAEIEPSSASNQGRPYKELSDEELSRADQLLLRAWRMARNRGDTQKVDELYAQLLQTQAEFRARAASPAQESPSARGGGQAEPLPERPSAMSGQRQPPAPAPKAEGKGTPKPEGPKLGPGAAAPADTAFSRTSIKELTHAIEDHARPGDTPGERSTIAQTIADKAYAAKDNIAAGLATLRAHLAGMYSAYIAPPVASDYSQATRRWSGEDVKSALNTNRFVAMAKRQIADPLDRQAITLFREAGGDRQKLRDQAAELARDPKTAGYAKMFERAANLSAGHEKVATELERHNQDTLAEAKSAGVLKDGLDNYMMHVWRDNHAALRRIAAESQATSLITKPSFTKQRTILDYFTGIKLGYKPASLDFADLVAAHERSFREALAARAYIKALHDATASDGRPLVTISPASAKELTSAEKTDPAYLIRPNAKPGEQYEDYRVVDHPALRGWRWAAKTPDGAPIFVQGDMLVHPEAWRSLHNNLTPSAIRRWEVNAFGQTYHPGRAALDVTSGIKGTILSLSGFHQATLGQHAIMHRTAPAMMREINLDDPIHSEAIEHGLMVAHYHAAEAFGEGLEGGPGGLVGKIPGIGPAYRAYTSYLFGDYMPRLKMAMYENALERNLARYGKSLDRDRIVNLSVDQSNAAFGGLNYKVLGRNQTMQDTLRLLFMAPDFTEARMRFTGQALKPYGREQLIALVLGAAATYTGARILNAMLDDKHDPHWLSNPFSLVYRGKEYSLRSIQGDLFNAIKDPVAFIGNRLSPLLNFAIEAKTGRDYWGKKQSFGKQLVTTAGRNVPIPLQPWTKGGKDPAAERAVESMLKVVGVNATKEQTDNPAPAGRTPREGSQPSRGSAPGAPNRRR